MEIINVQQGSEAWHSLRANHFTASEAPVMMAASGKMRRDELLHIKATGSEREVSDWVQKNLFDKGHAYEDSARRIVEEMIGQELFPATAISDDGKLLASFDGITMLEDILFEHKMWNTTLAESVRNNDLPEEYYWQLEQQLLVSGADCAYFVVSDGTRENFEHLVYTPVAGRADALRAGWDQFAADLTSYKAPELPEPTVCKTFMRLPALVIEVDGAVKSSNLQVYQNEALNFIRSINTELSTDQDFADAEQTVKFCDSAEKELVAVKQRVLAQTADIDELFRTIDLLCDEMRNKRLLLNKLVKSRKDELRQEIISEANASLKQTHGELNTSLNGVTLPLPRTDFAGAMKGKRTIVTLRSAVNDELARAKIELNQTAEKYARNLTLISDIDDKYKNLFRDLPLIIGHDYDHLKLLIDQRINEQLEAERKAAEAAVEAAKVVENASAAIEPIVEPAGKTYASTKPAPMATALSIALPKDLLKELVWSDEWEDEQGKTIKVIHREQTGSRRWESDHLMIFTLGGKLYGSTYSLGLTECQESLPYEYEPDQIECLQMEAYEVTVTRYRKVPA
ncbi:hypothetical protein PMPD1_2505 [Paramixta manurensis]|uniref:YqaJ viral recombinase domain-containing protein n=1 Tax=Paramixta manurensis TaxID=2740817 RepID=A0A6M8UGA8_9GAMM|nr:hypothetical protein PMPD1_2505 [Erwiniaceae bacterium PD-1]